MAALDLEDDVYIRVVDVGPNLGAVVRIPGGHSMVDDAGHWNGRHCIAAVRELISPVVRVVITCSTHRHHPATAG